MTKPSGQAWDYEAILAEIHRRKMTLTGIAEDAGVYSGACRQGIRGNSRPGAELIAAALNIPFEELFPTLYTRRRRHKRKNTRNTRRNDSAKTVQSADTERGAA